MRDVKVTGKKTKSGYEIGASEMPCILLHKDSFGNTRQQKLDEFKRIRKGVESVDEKPRNDFALLRGQYLEHAVVPLWLKVMADSGISLTAKEPQEAFHNEPERLGATLDRLLTVPSREFLELDGCTFQGTGALEVKTVFYDDGKLKPEWVIQVHQQMLCADLQWAIVLVFNQKGKLTAHPVERSPDLCNQIILAAREFWNLIEHDRDFPASDFDGSRPEQSKQVILDNPVVDLGDSKINIKDLAIDFQTAKSARLSADNKVKKAREKIECYMDNNDIEVLTLDGLEIKRKVTQAVRKESIEIPNEYYDKVTFSIKEK